MLKRICALLLCCVMLLCQLPALAETTDVHITFLSPKTYIDFDYPVDLSLSEFHAPSQSYNHTIARLSLMMTCAAFRDTLVPLKESDRIIQKFFTDLGFENYQAYGYHENPGPDTISNVIAARPMRDENGDEYILVAVPVCGQGYKTEWASNVSVGEYINHDGFLSSAQQVYTRLIHYIEDHYPGKRIKVWTSGFSRSGAVSNLLGHLLLQSGRFIDTDVFGYSFATPNTTTTPVAYPQLYCICNSFDAVPHVPLQDWGYTRHGTTLFLPARETNDNYEELVSKAEAVYDRMAGVGEPFRSLVERNWLLGRVLAISAGYAPDAQTFVQRVQDAAVSAMGIEKSFANKLMTFLFVADAHEATHTETWEETLHDLGILSKALLVDIIESNQSVWTPLKAVVLLDLKKMSELGLVKEEALPDVPQSSNVWVNVLSGGLDVVGEHLPKVYLSWLLSDIPPEELYAHREYVQIVVMGDVTVSVSRMQDGEEAVPLDDSMAAFALRQAQYLRLPAQAGRRYILKLKANKATDTQAAVGVVPLETNVRHMYISDPVTLAEGEEITLQLRQGKTDSIATVSMTDITGRQLHFQDKPGTLSDMVLHEASGQADSEELKAIISSLTIFWPYIISSQIIIIYIVISSLLTKKKHRSAPVEPSRAGRISMWIAAGLSAYFSLTFLTALISRMGLVHNVLPYIARLLAKAPDNLSLGTVLYLVCGMLLHALLAIECLLGVQHSEYRGKVQRMSWLMLFQCSLSIFVGMMLGLPGTIDDLRFISPLTALFAVMVIRSDERRDVSRTNAAVTFIRTTLLTAFFFVLFALPIWFSFPKTKTPAVLIVKGLALTPALQLAFRCSRISRRAINLPVIIALILYALGHLALKVSLMLGGALYVAGYVVMLVSFLRGDSGKK
ncbi:MAG: hypothetical protein Q4C54_06885 [Clostridia bacterium]|nr:hypothetical protein [Clostridia bacterium]